MTKKLMWMFGGAAAVIAIAAATHPARLLAQTVVKAALVRSVDEPGREPYMESQTTTCSPTGGCTLTFAQVPAGKRLVIRNVSSQIQTRGFVGTAGSLSDVPPGFLVSVESLTVQLLVNATVGSRGVVEANFYVPQTLGSQYNYTSPSGLAPAFVQLNYAGSLEMYGYADAGTAPQVFISTGTGQATISGYFVDIP